MKGTGMAKKQLTIEEKLQAALVPFKKQSYVALRRGAGTCACA